MHLRRKDTNAYDRTFWMRKYHSGTKSIHSSLAVERIARAQCLWFCYLARQAWNFYDSTLCKKVCSFLMWREEERINILHKIARSRTALIILWRHNLHNVVPSTLFPGWWYPQKRNSKAISRKYLFWRNSSPRFAKFMKTLGLLVRIEPSWISLIHFPVEKVHERSMPSFKQ